LSWFTYYCYQTRIHWKTCSPLCNV